MNELQELYKLLDETRAQIRTIIKNKGLKMCVWCHSRPRIDGCYCSDKCRIKKENWYKNKV